MRRCTVLFVVDEGKGEILLPMKKVRFGAGKYNGMGGGIEEGESAEAAAVREAQEEVCVVVQESDLKHAGRLKFYFEGKPEWEIEARAFISTKWAGEPQETEEMKPYWFKLSEIPYDNMWIDDTHWLPQVLAGQVVDAEFHFNGDGSAIVRKRVEFS